MIQEWKKKLADIGVSGNLLEQLDEISGASGEVVLDQNPPLLVELSSLSVVDIDGDDAQDFFQNQVCNDLNLLSEGQIQLNGYCNPKGRLFSLFTVYPHSNGYRLILPRSVAPALVKRLQMYVMRLTVSIAVRDDLVCSGLVLESSVDPLDLTEFDHLPALPNQAMAFNSVLSSQVIRVQDSSTKETGQLNVARYVCVAQLDNQIKLWQSDKFTQVGEAHWRWLEINAGIPNVYDDTMEQFIPQMVNMQQIDALSFKKGCYPGQEVVARMQYLGKLKKHMKHLRIQGATKTPSVGELITAPDNNNAGQIVDAVLDQQGLNVLAVVNIGTDVSDLRLADSALSESSLPYSLQVSSEDSSGDSTNQES